MYTVSKRFDCVTLATFLIRPGKRAHRTKNPERGARTEPKTRKGARAANHKPGKGGHKNETEKRVLAYYIRPVSLATLRAAWATSISKIHETKIRESKIRESKTRETKTQVRESKIRETKIRENWNPWN